jgi:riboflavin synthase
MELKDIQSLIKFVTKSGASEVKLEMEDVKITIRTGAVVNLERAMKLGDRLDGHIVQGHVDQTAVCQEIKEQNGSWVFTFTYDSSLNNITIEKGSVTVNGVSLTVVDSRANTFSVAIIPYTYAHTNFNTFEKNTMVNLEFDVIGKYVKRITQGYL